MLLQYVSYKNANINTSLNIFQSSSILVDDTVDDVNSLHSRVLLLYAAASHLPRATQWDKHCSAKRKRVLIPSNGISVPSIADCSLWNCLNATFGCPNETANIHLNAVKNMIKEPILVQSLADICNSYGFFERDVQTITSTMVCWKNINVIIKWNGPEDRNNGYSTINVINQFPLTSSEITLQRMCLFAYQFDQIIYFNT